MKRFLFASTLAALVPFLAAAQMDLQPAAIVKLTKTEAISVKQLKAEVAKIEAQGGRTLKAEERRQVLDVMINEILALQAAERDKVVVSDAELNTQLQQARASMKAKLGREPTNKEFEDAVKAETGLSLDEFKEQMRKQFTIQKYLTTKKRSLFEGMAAPTEAEIKSTYELSKAKLVRPDTVRFSMIFVPRVEGADAQKKARELAEKLAAEVGKNPGKFDEVALRGNLPNSGFQAGDGGYIPKSSEAQKVVGTEFLDTVFALKVGEVSGLLENQKGFQIVKVTETYMQKTLELTDLYQLGGRGTVREYIGNMLYQQKQQRVLKQATEELIAELRSGKPKPPFEIKETNLNW